MKDKNQVDPQRYRVSLRFQGMEVFSARGDILTMKQAGEILQKTIEDLPAEVARQRGGNYTEVLHFEIQLD